MVTKLDGIKWYYSIGRDCRFVIPDILVSKIVWLL